MTAKRREWLDSWNPLMPWESTPDAPRSPAPYSDENAQRREVLLVDQRGRPLVIREPRPVGFRRP